MAKRAVAVINPVCSRRERAHADLEWLKNNSDVPVAFITTTPDGVAANQTLLRRELDRGDGKDTIYGLCGDGTFSKIIVGVLLASADFRHTPASPGHYGGAADTAWAAHGTRYHALQRIIAHGRSKQAWPLLYRLGDVQGHAVSYAGVGVNGETAHQLNLKRHKTMLGRIGTTVATYASAKPFTYETDGTRKEARDLMAFKGGRMATALYSAAEHNQPEARLVISHARTLLTELPILADMACGFVPGVPLLPDRQSTLTITSDTWFQSDGEEQPVPAGTELQFWTEQETWYNMVTTRPAL